MDSYMHKLFTFAASTTPPHLDLLQCAGAGDFTLVAECASHLVNTSAHLDLSSGLLPVRPTMDNTLTALPLLTQINMASANSIVDWTRMSSLDCAWLEVFGQSAPSVPVSMDDYPAHCLGFALSMGLYATPDTKARPQEALGHAFHYYQSHHLFPQPDRLQWFDELDYHMRATHGLLDANESFPNTGDENIDEIMVHLKRIERLQSHLTSGLVEPCYQLGILTEVVESNYAEYTADVYCTRPWDMENITIWLYHKLEYDVFGCVVHDFWSPFGDGSYQKTQQVRTLPTLQLSRGIFIDPALIDPALRAYHEVHGTKTSRAIKEPSPDTKAYPNSSVHHFETPSALAKETLSPLAEYGLLTPESVTVHRGKKRARSPNSSSSAQAISSSPLSTTAVSVLRNYDLADPELSEQQRRDAIMNSMISVQDVMSPERCPVKFIMDGAKALTGPVILLIARHYPNKEIFERINAILTRDGFDPLNTPNVITRRISVAIESEAKRRNVGQAVVRGELDSARNVNRVLTGRGRGKNVGWTEPSTATSTAQVSEAEDPEIKGHKAKKAKLEKERGKKRRDSVQQEECESMDMDKSQTNQDGEPAAKDEDTSFEDFLRVTLLKWQGEDGKMAF